MASSFRWLLKCVGLTLLTVPLSAEGAGRVKLELFADQQAPITSQQQWLRQLGAAGISGVRIRTGQPTDKVGIEVQGSDSDPVYVVTGMIASSDEVILPGRRFRLSETPQLARWLDDFARKGLKQEEPPAAFGLSAARYEKVQKDLAQTVGFSTQGMDRSQAVRRIGQRLAFPLRIPSGAMASADDDKVAEELSGLSCGTGLACLLRPVGLGLVPYPRDNGVEYRLLVAEKGMDVWPVGWPAEKPLPQLLPAMYESFNANVQDVPVTTVLRAVSQRLKIPYLFDHNALARHAVEPDQKKVNSPSSRTTCNQLLRKVLSQAGLKSEIRLDEAGRPFLWITTVKPL
jgi:hypothetical protein